MPLLKRSTYTKRPWFLLNGHFETIVPSMFFKADEISYSRERIELEDGDFLDLDWLKNNSDRLLVLSHGLEGSSDRYYMKRTAAYFSELGWDVVAWNCRSCSGEMNRLPRFYHHGATEDLESVLEHAISSGNYQHTVLMGYSMGGSMSLKFLGEKHEIHPSIKGAVTFSVPVNLKDSAVQLEKRENRIYEKRFLKKLKVKIEKKSEMHPSIVSKEGLEEIKDFDTFHERYTVPLHGFNSIDDFYSQATCDQYLENIKTPVLIANAFNDPMLGEKCYPFEVAAESDHIFLEVPRVGGHVGFTLNRNSISWMEERARSFIDKVLI